MKKLIILLLVSTFVSCKQEKKNPDLSTLFTRLTAEETGINFTNQLEESANFDVFRYRNYYNGAGVSIGDINNDGLPDIYLTANSQKNRLFLNLGNFRFKDITEYAGVGGTRAWSTGVCFADVNADGFLDIYVCNSGDVEGKDMENELFINNGNLTFTESARKHGLDDRGFSTHAVFFDYDRDDDLDCYLLNNSFRPTSTLGYRNIRNERDELGGDKLLQNNNGFFTDVSEAAHIYGSVIGFGLGVTVGDINHDNWPDIYVANDFFERDYLYINNQDGTFSEQLENSMGHLSMFSMGADIADLNNDGYLDILSTDMLPQDDRRLKTIASYESYDLYQTKLKNGYYHQYMRNMLQLNNKDGSFSEIGQYSGVSATDWSWGALLADFNNDGRKDVFISNGIYRDVTDHDFLEFIANEENVRAALEGRKIDYQKVIKDLPSNKLSNFMYRQEENLQFKNVSTAWGLDEPSFSNGSAYGDLDNDGDLDLVINNVNQELFIYRNESQNKGVNNYLAVTFKGTDKNPFGLGAKVEVFNKSQIITNENMPIRGYQSSMDYKMIIGLGDIKIIDSMIVTWPNGKCQTFTHLNANQHLTVLQTNAAQQQIPVKKSQHTPWLKPVNAGVDFKHNENHYNDFNDQRLLMNMISTEGPGVAVGDINNDSLDDFFVGGASGQSSAIFVQKRNGTFSRLATNIFDVDSTAEDVAATFFDYDNDGDQDLYVVSGGSEFDQSSDLLLDRLYVNEYREKGIPSFRKTLHVLPPLKQNGSCVKPTDFDNDGDLDLFVGTRVARLKYGVACDQYVLENKGKYFEDVSGKSPGLKMMGMVTDAQWFDYDSDGLKDLVVVGEWMPVTILKNVNKTFHKMSVPTLKFTEGWWNAIEVADVDKDGDMDFIAGNSGSNTKFKASKENPVSLYVGDFDQNGSVDQVYTYHKEGSDYPISLKQDLSRQMAFLNKKFLYYKDFAGKAIHEIIDAAPLDKATLLRSYENNTCVILNQGSKGFQLEPLPFRAQISPVFGIAVQDLNGDGWIDLVLGGNMFSVKPEVGRYDASYGLVLRGNGNGTFDALSTAESGIKLSGEIKAIIPLKSAGNPYFLIAQNNDFVKIFQSNTRLTRVSKAEKP